MGMEQSSLSLVSTLTSYLEEKSSGSGLEIREYGCRDLLFWPRNTLYSQKLTPTSSTSGGRSVSIVHSQIKGFGVCLFVCYVGSLSIIEYLQIHENIY
jgi:hypothetical protein